MTENARDDWRGRRFETTDILTQIVFCFFPPSSRSTTRSALSQSSAIISSIRSALIVGSLPICTDYCSFEYLANREEGAAQSRVNFFPASFSLLRGFCFVVSSGAPCLKSNKDVSVLHETFLLYLHHGVVPSSWRELLCSPHVSSNSVSKSSIRGAHEYILYHRLL